jgi:hypothetical protein
MMIRRRVENMEAIVWERNLKVFVAFMVSH